MLINCLMLPAVLTTLALLGEVSGQVNSEIDQFEDLLAVDSFDNEVVVVRPRSRKAPPRKSNFGGVFRNQVSTRDKFSKQVSRGARLQRSKMNDDGSYSFRYETEDGMAREERGQPRGQGVTGSWSYTGADGKQYQMKFVADQFGFRPDSSHLHIAHRMAAKQAEMLARRARQGRARRLRP